MCFYIFKVKKGPQKGVQMEVVKRKIPLETITHVSLRYSWKEDKVDEAV